ncbi:hypothetical protein A2Z33_07675 [Candidatus Gottesmanbacteria bacterium RBG_16_52_11]|uniref:Carboxypeptidase regulatory-like domain-containing protein n=1 Tax=Candidatus Gottesmanbacteria bacterium RBG_16_52_11 TaxID=1798374 RepID=A0A1F5YN57_9BACT|nr:MAG: hypothetical protein A2Z33_07675 [Candidatus Gottesmanbacteria bacterium RBG_16_52_11]
MEQHPVPQNITTFQFRLVGDMTLKQFGYLAGGAIAAYVCYKLPLPVFFSIPLAVATALLGFGLAFVPIEERPMDTLILAFLKSVYSPTMFIWQREKPVAEPVITVRPPVPAAGHNAAAAAPGIKPAEKMTVKPAAPGAGTPASTAAPPIRVRAAAPAGAAGTGRGVNVGGPFDGVVAVFTGLFRHLNPFSKPGSATPPKPEPKPQDLPMVGGAIKSARVTKRSPGLLARLKGMLATVPKSAPEPHPEPPKRPVIPTMPEMFSRPVTPQVAGKPVEPVKPLPVPQHPPPATPGITPLPRKSDEEAKIERQTRELEERLKTLEKEARLKNESESRILELQKQLTQVLSERKHMESELSVLRARVSRPTPQAPQPLRAAAVSQPRPGRPTVRVITSDTAVRAGLPRLTSIPNVVTGIIKDHDGNLLPGVLVTVRDQTDVPLRALKTNKLGQFAASTPLPNNTYYIEVEDPRGRYVFDRIQVTLNGSVVPAVEVNAKSMKEINRDKLAKEIFNTQGI